MSKSSQATHQNHSDEDFIPKSFIIFCLDASGDIAFEVSWGESAADIKKFASLLKKINNGEFESMIVEQLKEQSLTTAKETKNYAIFNKVYKQLDQNLELDLVIDPTEVELN
jgi:hypothetical protein